MARPNLSYLKNMLLFLFGLPCGMFAGLTGVGASVVVQPLLRYLLGLRGGRLSGAALTVTFFAALSALLSYAQHGDVRWWFALLLMVGQTLGAVIGQRFVTAEPKLERMQWLWAALVVALGLFMCLTAFGTRHWQRSTLGLPMGDFHDDSIAMTFGVLVGVVSRVSGLGGALTVPAAVYGLNLSPQAAQGTAIVVLLLAALPSVLARTSRGELEPASATWMSLGAIFGGLIGAFYAVSPGLTGAHLTLIYGGSLILLGLGLLWREPEAA